MNKHFLYNKIIRLIRWCFFTFAFIFCINFSLNAQFIKVKKIKIDDDLIKSPTFDSAGTKTKRWRPKNWLEVELEIDLVAAPGKGGDDLDIMVKYYILINGNRKKYMITGSQVYAYAPEPNNTGGEKVFVSIYVSPSALQQITGKGSPSKSSILAVAAEIYNSGVLLKAAASKAESRKWWRLAASKYTGLDGFLLNKQQTPFAPLWWDRYLSVKSKR